MKKINVLDQIIEKTKLSKKETTIQQKIVETAIKMFAEKGYANTSTSEIAKTANVSEGSIFRHYGTKENLLLSVMVPFMKELIPIVQEEMTQELSPQNFKDFKDFLREIIVDRYLFIKQNRDIYQVVFKELIYREDLRNQLLPYFQEGVAKQFSLILDYYKAKKEIIDCPNPILIRMLISFVVSYLSFRFILSNQDDIIDEEEINHLAEVIYNGFKYRE